MPFLTLSSLVSTLASGAVHLAGHIADAAGSKAASAKQPSKGKTHTETTGQANGFAALLAVAATPQATAPVPNALNHDNKGTVAIAPGRTSTAAVPNPAKTSVLGNALPVAPPKDRSLPSAASPTLSPPVAVPSAAKVIPQLPATPMAQPIHTPQPQPASPSNQHPGISPYEGMPNKQKPHPSETPAKPTPTAPAKPLSHEAQGEVHLGIHAFVESSATPEQEQPTTLHSVSPLGESSPVKVQATTEATDEASIATTTAHPPAISLHEENLAATEPSLAKPNAVEVNEFKAVSTKPLVPATPSKHESAGGVPVSVKHEAPQQQPQTSSTQASPSSNGEVAGLYLTGATATSARTGIAAPPTEPLSDQLTRAFVTQATVVHREGRTDFLLRLDPPHLGAVRIHLTATDHTVSARIVTAQEETRQLLEGQAHQLRQGLTQAGLSLGSFDVTRDGGGGSQRQPPAEPPPSLPSAPGSTPRTVAVAKPVARSSQGIDLLA